MNKKLSKKLQLQLAHFALEKSYAYGTEWYSSAKNLDDELKARGITDVKMYYEYKMPGGLAPADYMKKLALYTFYTDFDWLFPYYKEEFENYIPDENDRLQVINEIKGKTKSYDQELTTDCNELIKINPELSVITDRQTHRDDILWGAVFGYVPDDIEYFCNGRYYPDIDTNMKQEETREKEFEKYKLKNPVGVCSPKTANMLISALKKNKQSVKIQTKGQEKK